jgi:hypothetical protein
MRDNLIYYLKSLYLDRKYRIPRIWSNDQLKMFSNLFKGKIINVSGWKDIDKEGDYYRNYFSNADEYWISNYKSEIKGYQGLENEFYLDLTQKLPKNLDNQFDVVFNHTTLEHVLEVDKAFSNLCKLSNDIVILIVPLLQEYHGDYGDYWRFSPSTIEKLFEKNGFTVLYQNFNNFSYSSIYIFSIASKKPQKWQNIRKKRLKKEYLPGEKVIRNTILQYVIVRIYRIMAHFKKK